MMEVRYPIVLHHRPPTTFREYFFFQFRAVIDISTSLQNLNNENVYRMTLIEYTKPIFEGNWS